MEVKKYTPQQVIEDDTLRIKGDVGDSFDADKQAILEQSYKKNQTIFRTIYNLELAYKDEWFNKAVELFGSGMVALYMANGVKEERGGMVNHL